MSDHNGDENRNPKRQKTEDSYVAVSTDTADPDNDPERSKCSRKTRVQSVKMLKPRAYQEEMLAESLRQNIIIAVRYLRWTLHIQGLLMWYYRWIQGAGRRRCMYDSSHYFLWQADISCVEDLV